MTAFQPHPYQRTGARFLIGRILDGGGAGLFFDPGLGKTATTLTVLSGLKRIGELGKVLIIAPLRVIYKVWPSECREWGSFHHLTTSIVHGTANQRKKALDTQADIYLINPESVPWLIDQNLSGFDTLIIDESTKFKSPSSKRFKALQKVLPHFRRRVILTGTPSPKSLEDLWSQIFILDGGERLGKRITHFRDRYFTRGGFENRQYFPLPSSQGKIEKLISDIVLRLDASELIGMPELIVNDVWVDLPPSALKAYKKLERELFFELGSIDETAMSSGAKYLMCRQVASGGLYCRRDDSGTATVHAAKLEAIEDLIEELGGKPLMVCYHFKHELARLRERFGQTVPDISGGVSPVETNRIIDAWNRKEIPLLFVQPQAMSHGLNMQHGGNDIAWLGLTDDLEVYLQANARIHRQGVQGGVRIHRILASSTVDTVIRKRIDSKDQNQQSLLASLREYARAQG